ncbi:unnamed protein product [Cuscuta europaea]|uniref:Uncharacterized protein n=1 Tax=Cuscuta europaea TaxID=41803 RepID=A0A9P0VNR7_CUSEU|nr:unnamed protein product [Cuscuta europaea]
MEDEEREARRRIIVVHIYHQGQSEKKIQKHSKRGLNRPISLKDINDCVISSENVRLGCSITIALVVVASHMSVTPHGGMAKSNSVIASRPLYVLILTDVTVVVARLLIPTPKEAEEKGEEGDDEWRGAFVFLEIGLVIYQAFRALFIDCSFYLVLVLCLLSFL